MKNFNNKSYLKFIGFPNRLLKICPANVNNLSKGYVLILFSLLITNIEISYSQFVSFSARSTETGFPVKLDSVKIIDKTNHLIITTSKNYADLSNLTSVNSDDSYIYDFFVGQNYPNPFDIDTKFSVKLGKTSPVLIKLFNFLGQTETEFNTILQGGKHIFQIIGNGLLPGLYFLSVNDALRQQVVKLIKNTGKISTEVNISRINTNQLENKITILNNSIFEFIGYSNTYLPDTLKVPYPKDGDKYEFLLDSIESNIIFKSGVIKFGGMASINERTDYLQSSAPGESYNKYWVDTSISNYSSDIKSFDYEGDGYNPSTFICRHVKSIKDTVIFCCFKGLKDRNGEIPSYNYLKLIIDTNDRSLKSLYFHYQTITYTITDQTNEIYENSAEMDFSFNNKIPYTRNATKSLNAQIKGNLSESDFYFLYDSKYKYYRAYGSYTKGSSCNSKKLTNFGDNSFISIDLFP